ncbi:Protein Hook -like protein 2 [Triplophysa tibetana]|uniref:Protein Hook-like protein 2 n=1 Tax=Triplophysa tibetana TaxID=1572043 RepID=A0A5A9NB22_9TELE|nr:Protein Hook -like protein 2 [Triplophysa tibetana]
MSRNKHQLSDSLFIWLQTFQMPSCTSKHELTSGVAIAHVLNKIDPSWFNETWLSRIKEDGGTNWRLKVSNLKKILQSIMEYYHDVSMMGLMPKRHVLFDVEVLGQQVSDGHVPDVCLIGEMGDVNELGRLLQLVLGCAVSCEHKQEHIQQIMTLEESVQHLVMTAIQESRKYYFLSEETDDRDDSSQRLRELKQQVSVLTEEKSSLQTELQSLRERLTCCEPSDISSTVTNKKLLLLQSQMEQLQEENDRLESSRDDVRLRGDVLQREVVDLQLRNEELTCLAQESQSLKDEMDVLRQSSERVSRLEAMVDTYKRKLEDLGDLRRQVRLLEERNHMYMQRTCELEEELRRASAVRTQLDTYKRQAHELSAKHSAEAMKAEKWQFEYKNLNDKYETLLKEKEKLMGERDALRDTTEELTCAQVQQQCFTDSLTGDSGTVGSLASEIMPAEFRDTVVRLQQENKMLCVQEESYRQRLEDLQNHLEESQRSRNTLETHNREKLHEAHSDLQKKREVIDDLEPHVDSNMAKKIDDLQEILKKKDEDMRRMEDRYKKYVEKARTVIQTLDPKQKNDSVAPEVQALKNQLSERDRKIQHLEHDFEKSRSRQDQEEKLIISAWYNMETEPLCVSGNGSSSEGGWRALWFSSSSVFPGTAETVHTSPERTRPPPSQKNTLSAILIDEFMSSLLERTSVSGLNDDTGNLISLLALSLSENVEYHKSVSGV